MLPTNPLRNVHPNTLDRLDGEGLILVLHELILLEASAYSIALRRASVPLNITVPDGGLDASVKWKGGPEETQWFPNRHTVFQS